MGCNNVRLLADEANEVLCDSIGLPSRQESSTVPSCEIRGTGGTRSLIESRAEVVPGFEIHVSADGAFFCECFHGFASRFVHHRGDT